MKRLIKLVLVVVILGIGVLLGVVVSGVHDFKNWGKPRIYSEQNVRSHFPSLPSEASQVYYSYRGFREVDFYLAFTGSKEKVDEFLQDRFSTSLASFKPGIQVPQRPEHDAPQYWEQEYQDVGWNIGSAGDLIGWTDGSARALYYSKNLSRLYVCEWGR